MGRAPSRLREYRTLVPVVWMEMAQARKDVRTTAWKGLLIQLPKESETSWVSGSAVRVWVMATSSGLARTVAMEFLAGRALLPLPSTGAAPPLPDDLREPVTRELADLLQQHLKLAGTAATEPNGIHALHAAAEQAALTARGLRHLRDAG